MSSSPSPPVHLGIDAGASKTAIRALAEGVVVSHVGGGCSVRRDGPRASAVRIMEELETIAEVRAASAATLSVGIPGAGDERLRAALAASLDALARRRFRRVTVEVVSDAVLALDAAFGEGGGVVIIAGTGSSVAARMTDGEVVTAGGWGPAVGDPGSATSIGRAVLSAVADDLDGGPTTALSRQLFEAHGLKSRQDLLDLVYGDRFDPASLAPIGCHAAARGDGAAIGILEAEARALADQAARLVRRLGRRRPLPARVAILGGVGESDDFRARLVGALEAVVPDWQVVVPSRRPEEAALDRARKLGL